MNKSSLCVGLSPLPLPSPAAAASSPSFCFFLEHLHRDYGPRTRESTSPAFSIPNLSANLQVPSTMAHTQSFSRFYESSQIKIERPQPRSLTGVGTEGRRAWRLDRRLRPVAVSTALVAAANVEASTSRKTFGKKDDMIGEVPPQVTNPSLRFAGLSQEVIMSIFQNKFSAINLYCLRHMRSLHYETSRYQDRIGTRMECYNSEITRGHTRTLTWHSTRSGEKILSTMWHPCLAL